MSIQIINANSEEVSLKENNPQFSVVGADFKVNGDDFHLLFTTMLSFNRREPLYGFSIIPDRNEPNIEEFIETLKLFDKLGKSFKKQKFYSDRTYKPLYSRGANYPYDLQVSYGDEIDFKVGDGAIQQITKTNLKTILDMMTPSVEGQLKITNINCETKLRINTYYSQKEQCKMYRLRLTLAKLHIIPYKKPEPTMFTLSLDDDSEEEESSDNEVKNSDEDEESEPEPEPEEVEH